MILKVAKEKKGITLIALVITIIVLLILAGISISMLTGQNGILNRAQEAKEQTQNASDLEYLRTEVYSIIVDYYASGSKESQDQYVLTELEKVSGVTVNKVAGTVTYNGKTYNISELMGNTDEQAKIANEGLTQVTDSSLITEDGKIRMVLEEKTESGTIQAVIPEGFYYVTGTPSTGLVISDVQGDDDQNTKGGNQFVWVPCNGDGGITYAKHEYDTKAIDDTAKSTADTGNGNWKTYNYRKYSDWTDDGGNEASVTKYGGFYIARYEAGIPKEAPFYNDTEGSIYWQMHYNTDVTSTYGYNSLTQDNGTNYANTYKNKNVTTYIPVSKKNTPSWNYISQTSAKTVSTNMYGTDKSVTSSLVDSYAWDTVTEWIANSGKDVTNSITYGNYYDASFTINGLYARHQLKRANDGIDRWFPAYYYNFGNYEKTNSERTETSTGSIEQNEVKNIYDLAGNMYEWTTETGKHNETSNTYAVLRGR